MRVLIAVLMVLMVGCTAAIKEDIEFQQGGRNVQFEEREWHENGNRKRHCTWGIASANVYGPGTIITVKGRDEEGDGTCTVTITFPDGVEAGAAATVNKFGVDLSVGDMVEIIKLAKDAFNLAKASGVLQ